MSQLLSTKLPNLGSETILRQYVEEVNDKLTAFPGESDESVFERMRIALDAQKKGIWGKAPNGKRSLLNPNLWTVVRTKAFKEWFGDWENDPGNASKVVDENGEPKVVTHATNTGAFTVFRRGERAGLSGKGIYFSTDGVGIWGRNIMRCFLNVRNPLTKEGMPWSYEFQ